MDAIRKALDDGRLLVFPNCRNLLSELKAYKYDQSKAPPTRGEFWKMQDEFLQSLRHQPLPPSAT